MNSFLIGDSVVPQGAPLAGLGHTRISEYAFDFAESAPSRGRRLARSKRHPHTLASVRSQITILPHPTLVQMTIEHLPASSTTLSKPSTEHNPRNQS